MIHFTSLQLRKLPTDRYYIIKYRKVNSDVYSANYCAPSLIIFLLSRKTVLLIEKPETGCYTISAFIAHYITDYITLPDIDLNLAFAYK